MSGFRPGSEGKSDPPKKRPRAYSRTGLTTLKSRVQVQGLEAIDKRTVAARALLTWRREMVEDLGGEENLSANKRCLVDVAVRTRLYVEVLDAYLMGLSTLTDRKRKAVLPVVRERTQLADSLVRNLQILGLERKKKTLNLGTYLAEKYNGNGSSALLPSVSSEIVQPSASEAK